MKNLSRPLRARGLKPISARPNLPIARRAPAGRGLKHTLRIISPHCDKSRPLRARGLKPIPSHFVMGTLLSRPAGAWIETFRPMNYCA